MKIGIVTLKKSTVSVLQIADKPRLLLKAGFFIG